MVHPSAVVGGLGLVVILGVAIASLVLNIVILNQVNDLPSPVAQETKTRNVDYSTGTINTKYAPVSQFLLNGLDETVDPCTDFYGFTCNKYLASIDLQKLGLSRLGTYDQAQNDVFQLIADILAPIDVKNTSISMTERITKAAFDSCSKNLGNPPNKASDVYNEMTALFGGVPFFGEPLDKSVDFFKAAGTIEQTHAVGTLFYSIASADYKKWTRNALYVSQPDLSMARDYYVKPQYIDRLNQRTSDVEYDLKMFALSLNKKVDGDKLRQAAEEIVNFEVQIAMASWPDDLLRNYQQQYNPYTLADLKTSYSGINFKSYINNLFNGVSKPEDQEKFNIVITQPSYFSWVNSVFSGQANANSTVVANYMIHQLLSDEMDFMSSETRQAAHKSNYIHYALRRGKGVTRKMRRTERKLGDLDPVSTGCMDILTAYMPYSTGYVYVKSQEQRNAVQADVKYQTELVIESFQEMIQTLTWMDNTSKINAKNKSDSLIRNYGWPQELFLDFKDTSAIDKYHVDYNSIVDIYLKDPNNLYDIMKVLKKGMEVRELLKLLNQNDGKGSRTNFLQSPAMVNAWYQPERNSITFPYAIWNPPYYNLAFPQSYNYAGQGGTGGHELTHGYDDEGVQFGFNGELANCAWNKCGWMDAKSSTGFTDMAQCVVTQFSTKCCPEKTGNVHCANGATTQGENIADLGGQQAAYRAYQKYVERKRNGTAEDRLPGLENYTPNQIFWITYGYSWCMKQSDANLVRQLLTNPHSPGSCRVNNVMQDIPEFGRDFGCYRGTEMYPFDSDRCKVWVGY